MYLLAMDSGTSALNVAVIRGDVGIVKILLENGADPYVENDLGMNAFDICTEAGPFPSIMRVLNKKAISRRSFLKSGTVTALGLTVMGPMVIGKNNAWSATFKTIGADDAATLIQMARDTYPHDFLADRFYAKVIEGVEAQAGKDKAFGKRRPSRSSLPLPGHRPLHARAGAGSGGHALAGLA